MVAKVARVKIETTIALGAADEPDQQHDHEARGQRDHGREPGVVDVGRREGHFCATAVVSGAIAASTEASPRSRISPGQSAIATMQATSGATTSASRSEISRELRSAGLRLCIVRW